MKRPLPLALLLGLTLGASFAAAQSTNTSIIDRAQQPVPPPAVPAQAEAAKALGQEGEDLGVQRIAQPRKFPLKLFVNTDSQLYFTDNVFLAPTDSPSGQDESDAVVLANTLSLRAETPSIAFADGLLTPSLGFSYQRYYHSLGRNRTDREQLDFDSFSAPLMLRYRNQRGWEGSLGVTAGSIYRLNGFSSYENIYRNLTPSLTVRKLVSLTKNDLLGLGASVGYAATWTDTPGGFLDYSEDRNDKFDYSLDVAYYHLRDRWTFNIYGRVSVADYLGYEEANFTAVNRTDTTFSLGASVTYTITKWASARLFSSSDWRTSTQDSPTGLTPFDYTYAAGTIGAGVSLSLTF